MAHVIRLVTPVLAAHMLLQGAAHAQSRATPLEFRPGNAKQAALIARFPEARELVSEPFALAYADLDSDGKPELILRADSSANCGTGGCLTMVLQERGTRMVTLLSQNLFPNLGVTEEKVGAYRALAALDDRGGIKIGDRPGTPLFGKPMVYAMAGQPGAAPSAAASMHAAAAATPPASSGDSQSAPAGNGIDVIGVRLGMPLKDALEVVKAHNPAITRWQPTQGEYALMPGTTFTVAVSGVEEARSAGGSLFYKEKIVLESPPGSAPPRVTGVYRRVSFEGREVTRENLLKSMTDKYGQPVIPSFGGGDVLLWQFDGNGRPFRPARACDQGVFDRVARTSTANIGEGAAQNYLRGATPAWVAQLEQTTPNCQTIIRVQMFRGANPALIMGFDFYASDETLRTQRFRTTSNHLQKLTDQKSRQQMQEADKRGATKF